MENKIFNYEIALVSFAQFLMKLKGEYATENKAPANKRIQSIDEILQNDELLRKLTDIQLLNDTIEIEGLYKDNLSKQGSTTRPDGRNLLSACVNGILVKSNGNIMFGNEAYHFDSINDLQKFLFEQIGFEYDKENTTQQEIRPIYYILDDLTKISSYETPNHVEDKKRGTK